MFLQVFHVKCVSLTLYQHCSKTPAHVVRTRANAVTSALAGVFTTRVIHGIQSQHSFNLLAEQMVSVQQANEIVAKLRELEAEQNLMKDLFNSAMRTSQTRSDGKLNFRQVERHVPGMFNDKATEYAISIIKMDAFGSKLDLVRKGGGILTAAATEVKDMDDDEVTNLEAVY